MVCRTLFYLAFSSFIYFPHRSHIPGGHFVCYGLVWVIIGLRGNEVGLNWKKHFRLRCYMYSAESVAPINVWKILVPFCSNMLDQILVYCCRMAQESAKSTPRSHSSLCRLQGTIWTVASHCSRAFFVGSGFRTPHHMCNYEQTKTGIKHSSLRL